MRNSLILFILITLLCLYSCEMEPVLDDFRSPDNVNSSSTLKLNNFQKIINTTDHGYLIAGEYELKTTLIRTDANFNTIWRNDSYTWGLNKPGGGWGGSDGYGISVDNIFQDEKENYVCICHKSWNNGCILYFSTLVAVIDQNGKETIVREFKDSYFGNIIKIPDGGYLLKDNKIKKLDENFNIKWEKDFTAQCDFVIKLIRTGDGRFALTSKKADESYVLLADPDGSFLSSFRYAFNEPPMEEIGYDIIQLPDQGFVIAGRTRNNNPFDMDYGITRIKASGEKIWSKKFGTKADEWMENFIYSSGEEFIIQGNIGYPNDEIQKTFLLKMNYNGQITDSCTIDRIDPLLYNHSGYFVMAKKVDANYFKLSKIQIPWLFKLK